MLNAYFLVGEILKPQGVRGEAKIKPYASNPDDFKRWKTLYLKEGEAYRPLEARCSRVHDGFAYVTLEGCTTPEDVERLRGKEIYVDRAHAAKLGEDEVYISDLIGCEAFTREGEKVGVLIDVLQYGTVDTNGGYLCLPHEAWKPDGPGAQGSLCGNRCGKQEDCGGPGETGRGGRP